MPAGFGVGVGQEGGVLVSGGGGSQTGVGGGVNGGVRDGCGDSLFQKTGLCRRSQALHGSRSMWGRGRFIFKMGNYI